MALDSQLVVLRVIVLLLNLKGLVNYCNLGLDSITLFRKYKKMTSKGAITSSYEHSAD